MSELPIIPQKAIDRLLQDSENKARKKVFDKYFGEGRADRIIASHRAVNTTQEAPQDPNGTEGMSFGSKVLDVAKSPIQGVNKAAIETAEFFVETVGHAGDAMADLVFGPVPRIVWGDGDVRIVSGEEYMDMKAQGMFGESTDLSGFDLTGTPKTTTGKVVAGISQFLAGFGTAGHITKLDKIRGGFVNGAIADAIVFEPDEGNLSNLLDDLSKQYGFDLGPVTDILATDPDDPRFLNRLKNSGEGVVIGTIFESIGMLVKARKAAKEGKEEAAKILQEEAITNMNFLDEAVKTEMKEKLTEELDNFKLGEQFLKDFKPEKTDTAAVDIPRKYRLTPEQAATMTIRPMVKDGEPVRIQIEPVDSLESLDEVSDQLASGREVFYSNLATAKDGQLITDAEIGRQVHKSLKSIAAATGHSVEALKQQFSYSHKDVNMMAADIVTLNTYMGELEKQIETLAGQISKGETGIYKSMPEATLALKNHIDVWQHVDPIRKQKKSNAGRTLRVTKKAQSGNVQIQKIIQDPTAFRGLDDMMGIARAIADPANVKRSTSEVIEEAESKITRFLDEVNSYRINALLSGPGTQEVNFISNVINGIMMPFEQIVGGALSGDLRAAKHGATTLVYMLSTAHESIRSAMRAGWMDEAIIDPTNQKLEGDFANMDKGGAIKKTVHLPTRLLMTMDEFFKQAQYRGRIQADAIMEANAQKLKGADRELFIKGYIKDSFDESGMAVREDALLQAQRATFTEPLTGKNSKMFQAWAVENRYVRFVVPFVKTPINILSNAYQHVPLISATSKRWQADFAAGGARRAQALGKWIVGSSLMMMAGHLAASDRITGSGPTDPAANKLWRENNEPYSFKDVQPDGSVKFTSFARLEPYNQVFTLIADFAEVLDDPYLENPEQELGPAMGGLFLALMENSVNKTFTQGLADFFTLLDDPVTSGPQVVRGWGASFVPNIMNQLNEDPNIREARTLLDMIMAKSFRPNGVDIDRNPLGEPRLRTKSKADPINVFGDDVIKNDPLLREMTRLRFVTGTGFELPRTKLGGPLRQDLTKIRYSETQSLYDRWIELSGTIKIKGKTMRETLEDMINADGWDNRVPDGGVGTTRGTKITKIKRVIQGFREAARAELPELMRLTKESYKAQSLLIKDQMQANQITRPQNLMDMVDVGSLNTQQTTRSEIVDLFK